VDRRDFLKAVGVGAVAAFAPSLIQGCSKKEKPNFLFILVDDLGWKDLGCYGSAFYETPNIDKLAASGMLFTDAYASCPVCSPTRASIMTGKYPPRLGITDWIPGLRPKKRKLMGPPISNQLALEEVTIAETLKEKGYTTFFAGKWHLGGKGYFPEDQGFDFNKGGHSKGSPPGGYYSPYKNPKLVDGLEGEYLTDRLTDESITFLARYKTKPFLLYLSFYTVHTPIQACVKHVKKFEIKAKSLAKPDGPSQVPEGDGFTKLRQDNPAYASMVYAMDENVGRLLTALKKYGIDEKTVVVFTSDNGGLSTLHNRGYPTSNKPLRAGKGWCYEGGVRAPVIIRAPGVTKPKSVCSEPVISMDFYPTMLDLAGVAQKPKQHVDGLSLLPLLNGGGTLNRSALYWHFPHYHGSTWKPGAAIRAGRWKLIEFYEDNRIELYDLKEDMGEKTDLSLKFPEKRDELLVKLQKWRKRVGAKMATPNPKFKPKKK